MANFVFLQKFDNGVAVPMPYAGVVAIAEKYGTIGRGEGDLELCFTGNHIADLCFLIGDEVSGIRGLGFERPKYDAPMAALVWELMQAFSCTTYDGMLNMICTPVGGASALPSPFQVRCVRQVSSSMQLWPAHCQQQEEELVVPMLRFDARHEHGNHFQFFDHFLEQGSELQIDVQLHLDACNECSLRVLRNVALHVDQGLTDNPTMQAGLRFFDTEVGLQFAESPPIRKAQNGLKLITAFPGESYSKALFLADLTVVDAQNAREEKLAHYLKQKYQLELKRGAASLSTISKILDQLHVETQRRLQTQAQDPQKSEELIWSWAMMAGAFLGNLIRTQVGGQWGYLLERHHQVLAVKTHSGHVVYPHLLALDHILNGSISRIDSLYADLDRQYRSKASREQDMVSRLPEYCGLLRVRTSAGGEKQLAFSAMLVVEQLDFSLHSLAMLDAYLLHLRANRATLTEQEKLDAGLAATAYMGEVARRNADAMATWHWHTYDDFAAQASGAAQLPPKEFLHLLVLEGPDSLCYPLSMVIALIEGDNVPSCEQFVLTLLGRVPDEVSRASSNTHTASSQEPTTQEPVAQAYRPERESTRIAAGAASGFISYLPFLLALLGLGLTFQNVWFDYRDGFSQLAVGKRYLLRFWAGLPACYYAVQLLRFPRGFTTDGGMMVAIFINLFGTYAIYGMNVFPSLHQINFSVFLWLPAVQLLAAWAWSLQMRSRLEQ